MTPMKSRPTRPLPKTATRRATPPAARAKKPLRTLVVGLTGPNASGKGEAATFLASQGFSVRSLSDVVRDEATRRGLDHSRDNLIRVGVEMRARHGPGALARRVLAERTPAPGPPPRPGPAEPGAAEPRERPPLPPRIRRCARRRRPLRPGPSARRSGSAGGTRNPGR